MKPEYVPFNGNDVHRKWLDMGWFRVVVDDSAARYQQVKAIKRRKQDEALDRQRRERAEQVARRRALGVQSFALVG